MIRELKKDPAAPAPRSAPPARDRAGQRDAGGKEELIRRRFRFRGDVQGVGLRWRARHAAEALGVTGWVRNDRDGGVSLELQGTEAQLDRVLQSIEGSLYIRIEEREQRSLPVESAERGFRVLDDRW